MNNQLSPVIGFVIAIALALSADGAAASDWNDTLQRISTGVVSIRVDSTRAFDTEWNSSSQATGFVVDARNGLILTNRHVVTPGPVTAEAIFINNEEVELTPVYRDPVHDFGLYRYDPDDLQYLQPSELQLDPEGAIVGREIRVIGNDAGEQLSILSGTIARLDRSAPAYGRGKYNDFNTYYLQAASGTSGGSSGSPVIDIDGRVVALNAGGSAQAASSFFLPLDRIARAVNLIRDGEAVARGTLQTVFVSEPFDELGRLGLTDGVEQQVRSDYPDSTGMLVVRQVINASPADQYLVPGDVLIRINSDLVVDFVRLAQLLDNAVGQSVGVEIQRGGKTLNFDVPVTDLHAISPASYLQFGDAIVHDLSYQQARHYNRPVAGVYVANPGYLFSTAAIPRGAVITEFDGDPISNTEELEATLARLADGEKVSVRYVTLDAPRSDVLRIVEMDRRWFPSVACARDDQLGRWPCRNLAQGPEPEPPTVSETQFLRGNDAVERALAPSLVLVNFDMPYSVSGVGEKHYYGTGVIVDAESGLVVVDRNTVPVRMGDVSLTFAGSLEVPAEVASIHPLHNLALVRYDPALIGATPARAIRFADQVVVPGDSVWVAGLGGDHRLSKQRTEVASVDALSLPLTRTVRFRDRNLEVIDVINAPENVDGVLTDNRGRVFALWSSFAVQVGNSLDQFYRGIPAGVVRQFVETVKKGGVFYSLEAEFGYMPLASARKLGLPEEIATGLERYSPDKRQVLTINRLVGGSAASDVLAVGDLVVKANDSWVNTFRDLEEATDSSTVRISVWRDDELLNLDVTTAELDGQGIDRALVWGGALLQEPHRPIAVQRGINPTGVYVAFFNYGSPATRYGLWGGRRIIEVDGVPTPDLDRFIEATRYKQHRESVRLKTVNFNDAVEVITLKLDQHYWQAYEIRLTESGWQRIDHSLDDAS